jgi:uncharacterized protein
MYILISPAKSLNEIDTPPIGISTEFYFQKEVKELSLITKKLKASDLEKLMDISPALSKLNVDRFKKMKFPLDATILKQAIYLFDGDVYTGLDAYTMSASDFNFANQYLRMLSGFYGLLAPSDLIAPYRLEMGTSLETKKGKNLYEFWGEKITNKINEDLKSTNSKVLLNLASTEYFSAVKSKKVKADILTIHFKENRNGVYKVISFSAKKARGTIARMIINEKILDIQKLKNMTPDEYVFDDSLSSEWDWVFVK